MSNISLVIIGTNLQYRFDTLINTIKSFKTCENSNVIDEIIVSCDLINGYGDTFDVKYISTVFNTVPELSNVSIYFKNASGMIPNQCNGVSKSKGGIIIYAEDDIIMEKLPSKSSIIDITQKGVICYNGALCYNDNKDNKYIESQFVTLNNDIFYKKEKKKYKQGYDASLYVNCRNWSVCFPCAIMNKDIFTKVYNELINTHYEIEMAFSYIINNNGYDSFIYCANLDIPIKVPWKYIDNCPELMQKSKTINRGLASMSHFTNVDLDNYNKSLT